MVNEYDSLKEILYAYFDKEEIKNIGKALYEMAEYFLRERQLSNEVIIVEKIFKYMIIDFLIDIVRLRSFHEIKDISPIKYRAYAAAWWVRRKPFMYKDSNNISDMWINERFALTLLLQSIDNNLFKSNIYDKNKTALTAKHIFYHLKYRDIHPQNLELFCMGLNIAKKEQHI